MEDNHLYFPLVVRKVNESWKIRYCILKNNNYNLILYTNLAFLCSFSSFIVPPVLIIRAIKHDEKIVLPKELIVAL